jgi:hypothetical protein
MLYLAVDSLGFGSFDAARHTSDCRGSSDGANRFTT